MRNALIIVGGIVVIVIITIVLSSGGGTPQDTTQTAASFEQLANLEFKDYDGNTVTLNDFAGTPLVVNTWAAWCPFCVKEMPDFAQVQEEFSDMIIIILIDRAESLDTAKRFSDKVGVTDRLVLLLDSKDSFYRSIGGFSMPETIFIDTDGVVKDHKRGPMTVEEMRTRIQQAFNL